MTRPDIEGAIARANRVLRGARDGDLAQLGHDVPAIGAYALELEREVELERGKRRGAEVAVADAVGDYLQLTRQWRARAEAAEARVAELEARETTYAAAYEQIDRAEALFDAGAAAERAAIIAHGRKLQEHYEGRSERYRPRDYEHVDKEIEIAIRSFLDEVADAAHLPAATEGSDG